MSAQNILIIGSRSGGMFLCNSLKHNIVKYFAGHGESFSNLGNSFDILVRNKERIEIYTIDNIKSISSNKNLTYKYIILAVREPYVKKALYQYNSIIKNCKYLFLLQNTNTNRRMVKRYVNKINPEINVFRLIISNGLEYLSPKTLYIYGKCIPLNLIIEEEICYTWNKIKKDVLKIFKGSGVEILNDENKIKYLLYQRHIKTLLSVFSLIYKKNLYNLVSNKDIKIEMENSINELAKIMKAESNPKKEMKNIFENVEVLSYYPSYFKNKYQRFKRDKEWKYFLDELKSLSNENGIVFKQQKYLLKLFSNLNLMESN